MHVTACGSSLAPSNRRAIFWACFTAIAATAAVFAVRGQVIGEWAREFGLTETQKGEILGVGLWPFAAAIVMVSLVADRIGYGRCLAFALVCHVASTVMLATTAIFPAVMLAGYLGLFVIFRLRGGYRAVILEHATPRARGEIPREEHSPTRPTV